MIQDCLSTGIVLITGGAHRVGLHCARVLARSGYKVHITYRSRRPIVDELCNEGIVCHQVDFEDDAALHGWLEFLQRDAPPIRALVHNASAWLAEFENDEDLLVTMRRMNRIHCEAPYLMNFAAEAGLKAAADPFSDIIHITDYVIERGSSRHIAYAASKSALDSLTRSFAKRFAPSIKVNSIAPSLLMFREDDDAEYRKHTLAKSVLGIEPGPQIVADALLFIMNNGYMTGRSLALDGGRHVK